MPQAERMSRVDTAWLRMDTDANLMMIIGVWLLRPRLALDELRGRVENTLLRYGRFKQRVVEDAVGASWVDDPDFDLAQHVTSERLKRRRGQSAREALKARVADLAAEPLDPRRPLWQFHLIEDLDGERSALVVRVHHCIGDGIALISVMLSITDGGKPPPTRRQARRVAAAPEGEGDGEPDGSDWLSQAVIRPFTDLTVKAIGLSGQGVARSLELLSDPAQPLAGGMHAAKVGYQVLNDVAALALMPDDSPTRLKGQARRGKRVVWGEPLPLDAVKLVGKAFGCSINDVLLSSVAGAIGDYLRDKGDPVEGAEIRAMVPVNLRPLSEAHTLGNRFGLVPLVLPIGIANPIERLYAVRARMTALKGSYQPLLAFGVLALSGLMIKPVQSMIMGMFAKKATAVMTNVPGPAQRLVFCGREIEQMMFWVPQSGDIGMGVSILSYGGGVQFGLITDARMCPDPEAIVARFGPQFDQLLWTALMVPWPVDT